MMCVKRSLPNVKSILVDFSDGAVEYMEPASFGPRELPELALRAFFRMKCTRTAPGLAPDAHEPEPTCGLYKAGHAQESNRNAEVTVVEPV